MCLGIPARVHLNFHCSPLGRFQQLLHCLKTRRMGCHGALLNSCSPHPSCTLKFTTGLSKSKVGNLWKRRGTGASETSSKGTQTETGQPLPPPGQPPKLLPVRLDKRFLSPLPQQFRHPVGYHQCQFGTGSLGPKRGVCPNISAVGGGHLGERPQGKVEPHPLFLRTTLRGRGPAWILT